MFGSPKRKKKQDWCTTPQAELNINRQMPHPSTSPCILSWSTGLYRCWRQVFVVSQQSLIHLSEPWVFLALGAKLRAEPQLCHGNLWTWSWTRPKTIDQIQTNTILALCFVPSSFRFILLPVFSFLLFPPHLIVSRWAFWPQAHYENKVPYPLHLLFSFFLFNSPAPLW